MVVVGGSSQSSHSLVWRRHAGLCPSVRSALLIWESVAGSQWSSKAPPWLCFLSPHGKKPSLQGWGETQEVAAKLTQTGGGHRQRWRQVSAAQGQGGVFTLEPPLPLVPLQPWRKENSIKSFIKVTHNSTKHTSTQEALWYVTHHTQHNIQAVSG